MLVTAYFLRVSARTHAAVKEFNLNKYLINIMEMEKKEDIRLPQKRFYRQRAHSNPISDHSFD